MKKQNRLKELILSACMAAFLCVLAPLSVPIGIVPVSLATFFIYLIGATLTPLGSSMAVGLYLLLGCFGLPVFSGFNGGIGVILNATGGFILGYLPCALIVSFALRKRQEKLWLYPVSMIIGTVLLYSMGTVWFMLVTKSNFKTAVFACVIPFLVFDAVKIAVASIIGGIVNKIRLMNE